MVKGKRGHTWCCLFRFASQCRTTGSSDSTRNCCKKSNKNTMHTFGGANIYTNDHKSTLARTQTLTSITSMITSPQTHTHKRIHQRPQTHTRAHTNAYEWPQVHTPGTCTHTNPPKRAQKLTDCMRGVIFPCDFATEMVWNNKPTSPIVIVFTSKPSCTHTRAHGTE